MKKTSIIPRIKDEFLSEIKDSVKSADRREIMLSQFLYALMNFAGGGGVSGLPMSQINSALTVKATYDGHRYHKGDKNFFKKRKHFFGNMYVGLGAGWVPRVIENIVNLARQYDINEISQLAQSVIANVGDIITVDGGPYNVYSLAAVLAYQLYGHAKHIHGVITK